MRLVVTGYRHWSTAGTVFRVLEHWLGPLDEPHQIGVGDCPTGADAFTRIWAVNMGSGVTLQVFHADWDSFGRKAGPIRNKTMINTFRPALVLAFLHPQSKGAVQCAAYAREQGIPVYEYWQGR